MAAMRASTRRSPWRPVGVVWLGGGGGAAGSLRHWCSARRASVASARPGRGWGGSASAANGARARSSKSRRACKAGDFRKADATCWCASSSSDLSR